VKTDAQHVWILRNGQAVAVEVTVGQTNGQHTEVTGGEVGEGMQVITDALSASR
jgi:HlyD family secretion protein